MTNKKPKNPKGPKNNQEPGPKEKINKGKLKFIKPKAQNEVDQLLLRSPTKKKAKDSTLINLYNQRQAKEMIRQLI